MGVTPGMLPKRPRCADLLRPQTPQGRQHRLQGRPKTTKHGPWDAPTKSLLPRPWVLGRVHERPRTREEQRRSAKSTSKACKSGPRAAKSATKIGQEHPKSEQERPKSSQDRLKSSQEIHFVSFFVSFTTISQTSHFYHKMPFEERFSYHKSDQERPSPVQELPSIAQQQSKSDQERPKGNQERPESALTAAQEQPKSGLRAAQHEPRTAKSNQERPKSCQE